MSTLMTERRRPPDNDDGQESLFGGEAFALAPVPGASAPWQRPAPARETAWPADGPSEAVDAGADAPFDEAQAGMFEEHAPLDDAQAGAIEAHVQTDDASRFGTAEVQSGAEYETAEPTAEDLAAYAAETASGADLLAARVSTEVPAHGAGMELEALERATDAPEAVRGARATLAGPTLDDVMSRVWEGLVTGLPAACPVCRGEVVASFAGSVHGSCSSCGTTIE